ncbi:MAG: hypothetical protein WKG01_38650 [Kofleriaceae bacterium]
MPRKRVPATSKLTRPQTVAYARKDKSKSEPDDKPDDQPDDRPDDQPEHAGSDVKDGAPFATLEAQAELVGELPDDVESPVKDVTQAEPAPAKDGASFATLEAKHDHDAAAPARARQDTVSMPAATAVGTPPEVPAAASAIPARIDAGAVEAPTRMPGPRDIPAGSPEDPAAPPGRVPPGDSRSLRKRSDSYEFALIYRLATFVITRFGAVGTRGQWRVVEYPTSASASHAYAKECSRFVSEGFSDYRD